MLDKIKSKPDGELLYIKAQLLLQQEELKNKSKIKEIFFCEWGTHRICWTIKFKYENNSLGIIEVRKEDY